MQQRRFDEAHKRIDEHLAKEPDDLAALRAKTWVQTVLKNYAGTSFGRSPVGKAPRASAHDRRRASSPR